MKKTFLIIFIVIFSTIFANAEEAKNQQMYRCLKSIETQIVSPHHFWSDRGTMLIYLKNGPDLGISPVESVETKEAILQIESSGRVRFYQIKRKSDGTAKFMIYDGAGSAPMIINPEVSPAFRQLSVWKKILPTVLGGAPERLTQTVGDGSLKTTADNFLTEIVKKALAKDIAEKGGDGYNFSLECSSVLSEDERQALLNSGQGDTQTAGSKTKNAEDPR